MPFLIKDVRIFDGESTIENGSVLVQDGKIAHVSPSPIPFSGTTISKPGHTLLPGVIDVHIHANGGTPVALPQALRFGVTTVCDMHNEWYNIQKLHKQREGGDCADLKTTSFAATIDMGWPMPIVLMHDPSPQTQAEVATWPKLKTPADAKQYISDRLAEGVDYIKLMHESGTVMGQTFNKPTLDLQKALIDEAHAHNLFVVAHATCLSDTLEILSLGVDGLTHTFIDQPPTPDLIAAYTKNNAHCNPTLAAMGSGTSEGLATQERFAHDPRVQHLISAEGREQMCHCMSFAKSSSSKCANAYETVRQLKATGVPILVGSDAAGPAVGTAYGLSTHQEMALLVEQCGFTPKEALEAATRVNAERFGFGDRGMIKAGMRADLVLVEGNPLEGLECMLDLRGGVDGGEGLWCV
ncbi:hypothetical protein CLAFUW4_08324 [Fulvia fulva]|uniref:Amidohydrolase-related domain-containing protein n=1 Tax=Passalora fulva TaxID=5499 RepID=A0A9Q8LDE7_PASFU|nr:uncharacterized protein CLAFUR5_08432 [Fulvia fulva]KAK4629106.1 hypothetical protein CLAFUR4_08329 [Fulvia fulva]UJO15397.1 hypothetical protein CLAFUR5_08432 [Fulvia fulva]WPV12074.1 hypothetical protein CLAFUW4_08324 [Fulvia fulva]WPV27322.1 hypothetical protein CLAFUW7_08324 [Fulvia fulva]